MAKYIDLATFRRRVGEGKRPKAVLRLAGAMEPDAESESRVVRFVFSDASVDRYGDTIDVRGWKLESYRANPVVLFGHNDKTVATVVGKTVRIVVEGDKLVGDIEFMAADVSEEADTVFRMVKGGYLSAVSVGFQPLEWVASKDKARPHGIDFKSQDLLEVSVVPVPANANSLKLARAAGIDVDRLKLSAPPFLTTKGLYEVSWLAGLLNELGYLQSMVAWEAEHEDDDSPVPAILLDALKQLGAALVAMSAEEVAELLGEAGAADGTTAAQKALRVLEAKIKAAPIVESVVDTPDEAGAAAFAASIATWDHATVAKALRAGALNATGIAGLALAIESGAFVETRAGRKISATTAATLQGVHDKMAEGCAELKALLDDPAGDPAEEPDADTEEKAARERRARKAKALSLAAQ